jgi:ABC-type multidrug transport system ATPase subunit
LIEARGVTKRFGGFQALKELNLEVKAGEVFGYLGPNGAGKSTTTKILCGLLRPSSGHATVAGFDVAKDRARLKSIIGYLPERVPVYRSMTAREFLTFFARVYRIPRAKRAERVEHYLKVVNLAGVERRPIGKFSKGMVQRLGIARALLPEPQVLFLDEPASGLDPTGRREIRSIIQELGRTGHTVFLCSHDLAEVQATCQRIGFIRRGELVRVQRVGESGGQDREFTVELVGGEEKAAQVLGALAGVKSVKAESGGVRVRTDPTVTRADVARAVQKAGLLHLGVVELTSNLETLYRTFIEEDAPKEAAP